MPVPPKSRKLTSTQLKRIAGGKGTSSLGTSRASARAGGSSAVSRSSTSVKSSRATKTSSK